MLRFVVVVVSVYVITFAAAWLYGGFQKIGSADPGHSADQALAPIIALIVTVVAAGTWTILELAQRLRRQR